MVAPQYFEPTGAGWLRSFFGGALTTCGLRQVGAPCEDEGEALGLHGRIANLPAEQVAWGERWEGDRLLLWCRGVVRETQVFGEDLRLEREIAVVVGEPVITVRDRITNLAETASPFMLLYHCNAGFPLVQATSRLLLASQHTEPSSATPPEALAGLAGFAPPQRGFREQVFTLAPTATAMRQRPSSMTRYQLGPAGDSASLYAGRWRNCPTWSSGRCWESGSMSARWSPLIATPKDERANASAAPCSS
ncbi:MAG TPA: DUF4432 family protein [Ktedonobacterales bacterium]|nr:DUF4432 family protein [Ktedonobacterales bacterium]